MKLVYVTIIIRNKLMQTMQFLKKWIISKITLIFNIQYIYFLKCTLKFSSNTYIQFIINELHKNIQIPFLQVAYLH